MILVDVSHTSHTHARTGIQRVSRSLVAALASTQPVAAITWDPYARRWRTLQAAEQRTLAGLGPPAEQRGSRWPWSLRLRGLLAQTWQRPYAPVPPAEALIVPEIFSATVSAALPLLRAHVKGPRVALFHDAIALRLPELTPSKTVARFPAYLRELLDFDGVAAVSEDSRAALADWWQWLGVPSRPSLVAIPLGIEEAHPDTALARTTQAPVVLSVGSLEGRKNHSALLEACESLWRSGHHFELRLIGLAHAETGRAALDRIRALQAAGRPLRYDGAVDDPALRAAYHECAFTVYPSLMEGFGLPVLESVRYGKPCICSQRGALGESAAGGGCLSLPTVDAPALAEAIGGLLRQPDRRAALSAAAHQRRLKTWALYATELRAWMNALPIRGLQPREAAR